MLVYVRGAEPKQDVLSTGSCQQAIPRLTFKEASKSMRARVKNMQGAKRVTVLFAPLRFWSFLV